MRHAGINRDASGNSILCSGTLDPADPPRRRRAPEIQYWVRHSWGVALGEKPSQSLGMPRIDGRVCSSITALRCAYPKSHVSEVSNAASFGRDGEENIIDPRTPQVFAWQIEPSWVCVDFKSNSLTARGLADFISVKDTAPSLSELPMGSARI